MKYRSPSNAYQPICDEFGKDRTNAKRRELTTELGRLPSYLELYAALCLEAGPHHEPVAEREGVEQ